MCREVLKRISVEPWADAVLGRAPAESLRAIEDGGVLSWIACRHLDEVNQSILEEIRRDVYVEFWRRYATQARGAALFAPFFSGGFGIFGKRPEGLLRWIGKAWHATTRGYGNISFGADGSDFHLLLSQFPQEGNLETVAASLEGSILGVLDLADCPGHAHIDSNARDCIRLVVGWD